MSASRFFVGPGIFIPALVVPEDLTFRVRHPSQLRDVVCERLELGFALAEAFLIFVLARDVTHDFRGANNRAAFIMNGRDRDHDGDCAAVLVKTDCLEIRHGAAGLDCSEDFILFTLAIFRDQYADRLAYDLLRCVTEHAFGGRVPAGNDTVQVF